MTLDPDSVIDYPEPAHLYAPPAAPFDAPLPREVVVVGQRYQVKVVDDWESSLGPGDDGSAVGLTYHPKLTLTLRAGQAPDYMRDTVLHEVVHAVVKMTGSEMDEDVVARVSTALLDALRHSPGLAEYLLDGRGR